MRIHARPLFLLATVMLALVALSACGGGSSDNLNDIKQTATAAAQRTPSAAASASPTADPGQAYLSQATTLVNQIVGLLGTLHNDLLAAQANQADPKWPGVLTADCDLVSAKATEIANLPRPGSVPNTLTSEVRGTANSTASAADLLKSAVHDADPTRAAQAVATLEDNTTIFKDLLPQLAGASPTP